ncbi:MAG: SDR family oxidoreductase [Spirochaetales bacterium]|nr:SDR family oxidoreductase [Spirochaetales bacterium]
MKKFHRDQWALILGGSSGFGLATAKKLAQEGMSVCILHRDRKGAMERIEQEFDTIRTLGGGFLSLNVDALSEEGMTTSLDALKTSMGSGKVRVLLHSIAFGNLKPIVGMVKSTRAETAVGQLAQELGLEAQTVTQALERLFQAGVPQFHTLIPPVYGETLIEDEDMSRTVFSMGTSLLTWVQKVFTAQLFASDARVFGMTSEGNEVAWRGYAAVSAAKTAMEAVSRAIAVEFAPYGIRSNIIQAGVTETPALAAIPGNQSMKAAARLRNPFGRLTVPEDVANVISLLCTDEAAWINGALIRVDGGEHVSAG